MLTYKDIDKKEAYIFELDDVLYPQRDYLLQVYYLFANFMEYMEGIKAGEIIDYLRTVYEQEGSAGIFTKARKKFGFDEKYRENFDRLQTQAELPLKLLLFPHIVDLLQAIIMDRKQLFILTKGHPKQQLNKIKYIDWKGLDQYITVYFAEEFAPKPAPSGFEQLINKHNLLPKEVLLVGLSDIDQKFANVCGIDFVFANQFIIS